MPSRLLCLIPALFLAANGLAADPQPILPPADEAPSDAAPSTAEPAPEPKTYEDVFGRVSKYVPAGVPLLADPVIGFDPAKMGDYSDAQLLQQAEFHWAYYEAHESNLVLDELLRRDRTNSEYIWRKARNLYDIGEELPDDDKEGRMKVYEEMIALTQDCMNRDEKAAACVFFYGVGHGRASTTRGLAASLFAADEVEESWLKALEMPSAYTNRRGDSVKIWSLLGLGIFYRMVPDWWIVKLVVGTRGDKEKSIEYLRRGVAEIPNRIDMRKELGVSLICYGAEEDDEDAIKEGREILEKVAAGTWRDYRNVDPIDMRHAKEILQREPDEVCGYSRDGYEKVDKDNVTQDKIDEAMREKKKHDK